MILEKDNRLGNSISHHPKFLGVETTFNKGAKCASTHCEVNVDNPMGMYNN